MATRPFQTMAHQFLIAMKLAVMTGHQAQSAQGPFDPLQRIACVKNFKRVLKRVATPAIHRCINLDVSPGEHEQRGLKLIHHIEQNTLNIKNRQGCQIKNALRQIRKTLVQVISQINRANREDRIAWQAHKQDSFACCP